MRVRRERPQRVAHVGGHDGVEPAEEIALARPLGLIREAAESPPRFALRRRRRHPRRDEIVRPLGEMELHLLADLASTPHCRGDDFAVASNNDIVPLHP